MQVDLIKLKIAQAKACLSTNELIEITQLSKSTISRILNGHTNPSAKSFGLIAKALNVDVSELIIK